MAIDLEEVLWRASVDGDEVSASGAEIQAVIATLRQTEAKVQEARNVAIWIRDHHGDYISREIEERLLEALSD